VTDMYAILVIALGLLLLIMILDKMGKGIVLRESTAILYVITCLVMPLVGYTYYTRNNQLANIWVKYMVVPENVYFDFALPAISCFCLALTWPLSWNRYGDEGPALEKYIQKVKSTLSQRKNFGIHIMAIGMVVGRLAGILPGGLQFFANLFFFAAFAGLLYVYFARDFKYKKLLIGGFIGFIFLNALGSGMFTIIAYMGVTIYSFFLIDKTPSLLRKAVLLLVAIIFIIVLQNTKIAYRKYTWKSKYEGSKIVLFANLFFESLQKGDVLIENRAFFSTYARTNQGFNVALVMRRIPKFQAHDGGVNLLTALASSVVPRFLWPDKPEAGGKFNMKYYANVNLQGWSTNIGPLGEAYGSFGVKGGIVFMFFLGGFIRWVYKKVLVVSDKIPLLICWIPVLFYQITYSGETDTLQILNSIFKSALFIWIIYKLMPGWFGKAKKDEYEPRVKEYPSYNL
jgi:hypothetical protein